MASRQAEVSVTKGIVLDANILVRAVFGQRVPQILSLYADQARFYSPDVCFADARKYIRKLSGSRELDPQDALAVLEGIGGIVEPDRCPDPRGGPTTRLRAIFNAPHG